MAQWVKVAAVSDIAPGQKKQVDVDGVEIVVCNVDGEYCAIEDVCTHDGAPLGNGRLRGEEIVCPRHGARFNVKTGAALSMPAVEPVETYPVKVDNNNILVEVEL